MLGSSPELSRPTTPGAQLEAMNVLHVGRNTGAGPVRILAVFLGAAGEVETMSGAGARR